MSNPRRPRDPNQPHLFDDRSDDIERRAEGFAQEIRRAVERAQSEEDIRVAFERQIAIIADTLGIRIEGQHEFTLLRGRVDSVYGSVFIEYKDPSNSQSRLGPRLSSAGTARVVDQIRQRFRDVQLDAGSATAIVGVGCDGRYLVFCRLAGDAVSIEEPVEVSRWSIRRLLWALFNLGTRGYALTPAALARDFGSDARLGKDGVRALARAASRYVDEPRVAVFLQQWRVLFGEVCGYDLQRPGRRVHELSAHYAVGDLPPDQFFFGLHTYYALLMKLLAAHVASFFQRISASPLRALTTAGSSAVLQRQLQELEDGGVFRHLGVTNFLEGDLFSWYLSAWTPDLDDLIRSVASQLLEYNPASLRDNPIQARDLLKKLYHELFPKAVRHDLGEYYTPDWLADLTLDRAGYDGNPRTRLLDPACGSGTFLVLALARIRTWLEANYEAAPDINVVAEMAARNLIGFDLNPLAVLAARTNFLIHFYDSFNYRGPLEIPIYLADSVLTPSEYGDADQPGLAEKPIAVPTSARLFLVPREVARERRVLALYCNLLGDCARAVSGYSFDEFAQRCRDEGLPVSAQQENVHRDLFEGIRTLDRGRRNGVWARFIKNAFAPVFLKSEPVDLVVGNPPWINWESLPGLMEGGGERNYRQHVAELFKRYGLFSLSGASGRLGGGKKDLSMLFVYVSADSYLKTGGTLAFVITQTVFKTQGAGDGFRKLVIAPRGPHASQRPSYLRVAGVDDLSSFQPFDGATNRTAVFACKKDDKPTSFPVPYRVWKRLRRGRIEGEWSLPRVLEGIGVSDFVAVPVAEGKNTSPWLTVAPETLGPLRRVIRPSAYVARAGCCTWLNGVYWVRTEGQVPGGILIENLADVGRIKVSKHRAVIEPELLFPLLRGRDVGRWHADASLCLVLPQDVNARAGIEESVMRRKYSGAYAYLKLFESELRGRSGFKKYFRPADPFYSVYNVGSYTLAQWKVVWREQSREMQAAVLGPGSRRRPPVPDHKVMFVECPAGKKEAHFICALLNSKPAAAVIAAYVISTSTSTHILEHVGVPEFESENPLHAELSALSLLLHEQTRAGVATSAESTALEKRLDELVGRIWGLSPDETAAIAALASDGPPDDMTERVLWDGDDSD